MELGKEEARPGDNLDLGEGIEAGGNIVGEGTKGVEHHDDNPVGVDKMVVVHTRQDHDKEEGHIVVEAYSAVDNTAEAWTRTMVGNFVERKDTTMGQVAVGVELDG